MNQTTHRRQRIVVDKELQQRMVVAAVWPSAISYLVIATSLFILYIRMNAAAAEAEVALAGVKPLFVAVLLLFFAAATFSVFHALRLSHRIAGPLYRFRETLRAARTGNFTARAKLRDGDLLFSTANELNEFLDWVQEQPGMETLQAEESETEQPDSTDSTDSTDAPVETVA